MEEQPQTQPTTIPVNPTPELPIKQTNRPSVIILVSVFLLMIFGLVYLGYQNYRLRQEINQLLGQQTNLTDTNSSPNISTTTNKLLLSQALSQFCTNNKINLDKLPFTLNETIKTTYGIQDSINCFAPEESYANIALSVEKPDFIGDVRNVYFFHQDSVYMGMDNNFQPLDNFKTVTIDGQNYWLNVREPGPYGISSLGVWVDLIGEKRNTPTGTIARVITLNIIKDQSFLDLVKKYGAQASDAQGETIYIVGDDAKKAQFINEIVKLAPQNNELKMAAQNITSDLGGISF